jgi:ferredoxin-NADP reductase
MRAENTVTGSGMSHMNPSATEPLLRIAHIQRETDDARTFEMEVPVDLRNLYAPRAGQFLRVRIPDDPAELARSYSVSSAPALGEPLRFTVKHVPGGMVSERLVKRIGVGESLHVAPPAGTFTLRQTETPLLLIAGGSGITPVYSLLKTALHTTQRPILLLYANRNQHSAIFASAIDTLARRFADRFSLQHHFSDEEGFLNDDDLLRFASVFPRAEIYLCGPTPLMDLVERTFDTPDARERYELFLERFLAPSPAAAVPPAPMGEPKRQRAAVVMRVDGEEHAFEWTGTGTLLDAALAAGVPAPHSCREGHCGACKARLEEGKVEQGLALALSKRERERGDVLACCSIPLSDTIVLDYD